MDLIDRLNELAARVERQLDHLKTEEATKNALIMPFIQALGYDVFDPTEVVPEFTADVGTKKGEKVDYVILRDGKPCILVECKTAGTRLDVEHTSQLYRYFSVTEARFGVLTDGIDFKFFSDLEAPNKMDSRPFLTFSLREVTPQLASELKQFSKEAFDLDSILSTASDLKHRRGIKRILAEEWANPSDELVRLLAGKVYSGRMTQGTREQFAEITREAFHEFLSERVNQRLKSALEREGGGAEMPTDDKESGSEQDTDDGIVTTEEELEGFYVVKAIVAELVDSRRVFMRDRKRYCGILLDDTNRKPICRLWFNSAQKYVGTFDTDKSETKHPIARVEDIFSLSDQLRETVRRYEGAASETSATDSDASSGLTGASSS